MELGNASPGALGSQARCLPHQLGTVSQKGCVGMGPGLGAWPGDREGPGAPGHLVRVLSKGGRGPLRQPYQGAPDPSPGPRLPRTKTCQQGRGPGKGPALQPWPRAPPAGEGGTSQCPGVLGGDQIQRTVHIPAGTLLDKPELPGLITTHHPKSAWSGCPGATEGLKRVGLNRAPRPRAVRAQRA